MEARPVSIDSGTLQHQAKENQRKNIRS
jgi:hypothetical protein